MSLDLTQALDLAGYEWPRDNKLECPQGHDRDSASLHLYDRTDSVYCFGCGFTADAIGTLAALTGKPVAQVLAQYGEGWKTTEATKNLSRHKLKDRIRFNAWLASYRIFDAIKSSKKLRHWQRNELLMQATYWADDKLEEIMELPPFKAERRIKQLEREADEWLKRWKV